jgi:hypothetical protein
MSASALIALLRPSERLRGSVMPRPFAIVLAFSCLVTLLLRDKKRDEKRIRRLTEENDDRRSPELSVQIVERRLDVAMPGGDRSRMNQTNACINMPSVTARRRHAGELVLGGHREGRSNQLLVFVERHLGAGGES